MLCPGAPACRRQPGKLLVIFVVWIMLGVGIAHNIEHDTHEDAADGMNGVMAAEALVHQPGERRRHLRRLAESDLVLYDHMGDGVNALILKVYPLRAMIR